MDGWAKGQSPWYRDHKNSILGAAAARDQKCCSYRLNTSHEHECYSRMKNVPFEAVYFGLVEKTTIHGLPHIHIARGCIKKTIWSILTLVLTCVWLWNATDVILTFRRSEVTITYDIRSEKRLLFPAITICNQNIARASKIRAIADMEKALNASQEEDDISQSSEDNTMTIRDGLAKRRSKEMFRKKRALEYLAGLGIKEKAAFGHEYYPLIASCKLSGYPCYMSMFERFYDPIYGNCYTFNTGAKDSSQMVYAYTTGSDNGLEIQFGIEQNEYLGAITPKAGIRVVIHPHDNPAFPSDHGIDIPPGTASSVAIRKVTVDRLGQRYGNCVNTNRSSKNHNVYEEIFPWTKYTLTACHKTCYQRAVMEICYCFDSDFPKSGAAFRNVNDGTLKVCSSANRIQASCKKKVESRFAKGVLRCPECIRPCDEEYFTTAISTSLWPADNFLPTLKENYKNDTYMTAIIERRRLRDEVGVLEIYYESLNVEEIVEQPAYETSQFIADLGGSIGLWLGASVMTIFEFVEFAIDILILLCAKCCGGASRKARIQSPDSSPPTPPPRKKLRFQMPEMMHFPGVNPENRHAANLSHMWRQRPRFREMGFTRQNNGFHNQY